MLRSNERRLLRLTVVLLAMLSIGATARAQCFVSRFLADETLANDQLGDAVAISGSLGVVGASRHDAVGSASGAAFVFRYGPDEGGRFRWGQEARLLADGGAPNDLFGAAVAIDGAAAPGETIVVGAYFDDNALGNDAGAAYVFEGQQGEWSLVQTLTAPDGATGDQFGEAVAVRGDLLVVGAPRHDGTALNAGAVYVYRYSGSLWAYETTLEIPMSADHDLLGVAVAVDGDLILAGAAFNDHAGTNSGAAYAFRYGGAEWGAGEFIAADDAAAFDKFAESVAVRGDLALIGSALDDDGGANSGSVYVFRFDGLWTQSAKLRAVDSEADARFGASVALSGGVQDNLALIGASGSSDEGIASGAAYLYTFDGVDWVETWKFVGAEPEALDQFGTSVATGDQFILVGANMDDDEMVGSNAGSVTVFTTGLEELIDCNGNGESDFCDLASGFSLDCNENGVLDDCDIADGTSDDENENGIPDECDDCNDNLIRDDIDIQNGTSEDCNTNGIPDECEIDATQGAGYFCVNEIEGDCDPDCNENLIPDECDILYGDSEDCNANGIPDSCDIEDETSQDEDGNGVPDECFSDCNGNGVSDQTDITDGTSEDCNGNDIPDECDIDILDPDGNGETSLDLNDDGIPDECQDCNQNDIPDFFEIVAQPELDCNENGMIDVCEIPIGQQGGEYFCESNCDPDCNLNGVPDECDIADGTVTDCDENGVPDQCDPDCNDNGIADACDISEGTSEDANTNGIPDECEDCNGNGTLDSVDISSGTSEDCNTNLVPDECEIPTDHGEEGEYYCTTDCDEDCNENGVPDSCDLEEPNTDLNDNGILDACEADCNENGYADALEILWGLVEDENGNGIPDECETCPGDADFDGIVGFSDVLIIIRGFGPCEVACPGDFNGNWELDFEDVLTVLSRWGPCPKDP